MNNTQQLTGAMLRVAPETRDRLNQFVATLAVVEGGRQSQDSAVTYLLDRYEREIERKAAATLQRA